MVRWGRCALGGKSHGFPMMRVAKIGGCAHCSGGRLKVLMIR